jgi:hypothetical protein
VLMAPCDLVLARDVRLRIGMMREGKLRCMMDAEDIRASELEPRYLEGRPPWRVWRPRRAKLIPVGGEGEWLALLVGAAM